jgi:hypothetical protein
MLRLTLPSPRLVAGGGFVWVISNQGSKLAGVALPVVTHENPSVTFIKPP